MQTVDYDPRRWRGVRRSYGTVTMTEDERDAITDWEPGEMVYNTTTNKLNFWNGTAFEAVTSA
jgi:hypothetical protein